MIPTESYSPNSFHHFYEIKKDSTEDLIEKISHLYDSDARILPNPPLLPENPTRRTPNQYLSIDINSLEKAEQLILNGNFEELPDLIQSQEILYGGGPQSYTTLLNVAIVAKNWKATNLLINTKAPVNLIDCFGKTALMYASESKDLQSAKLLLEKRACPNINKGKSALMISVKKGDIAMIRLLLEHRADPNVQNIHKETALFTAIARNDIAIIELLKNTDIYRPNFAGTRVFDLACESSLKDLILKNYHSPFQTQILYHGPNISKNAIAFRRKDPLTKRTQLIIQTPDKKIEKIYQQIKLSKKENSARPQGAFKICKPILTNGEMNTFVRIVIHLNNWKQGGLTRISKIFSLNLKTYKRLERERGIAKLDLAVATTNKNGMPSLDLYQKKYVFGDLNMVTPQMLSKRQKIKFTLDLLHGLRALHSNNMAHCDIKPSNILLDEEEAVITDFDLVVFEEKIQKTQGTFFYFSPEIARRALSRTLPTFEEQKSADIWAMGLTLHKLWFNTYPSIWEDEYNKPMYLATFFRRMTNLRFPIESIPQTLWNQNPILYIIWHMLHPSFEKRIDVHRAIHLMNEMALSYKLSEEQIKD